MLFKMFTLPTLLTLFLFVLFSSSYVQSKNDIVCHLAAFIEDTDGKNPQQIDSGRITMEFSSCSEEEQEKCKSMVEEEVILGTQKGNFSLTVDNKDGYTIGDVLCDKADTVQENVKNKLVHIYWKLCGNEWKETSFRMPEPLCCDDGLYVPCRV